jgi:Na+-transporting NADH:ubiquinone oxidoreductase subunit NqrE
MERTTTTGQTKYIIYYRNSVKLAKFTTIFLPSEVLSNLQFRNFFQCTFVAMSAHCIPFLDVGTPVIIILRASIPAEA